MRTPKIHNAVQVSLQKRLTTGLYRVKVACQGRRRGATGRTPREAVGMGWAAAAEILEESGLIVQAGDAARVALNLLETSTS